MKDEDCLEIDWTEQTLQVLAEAAQFGVPDAKNELEKRLNQITKFGTVTPQFSIEEDEE
jgi:uncharacterized protein YciW